MAYEPSLECIGVTVPGGDPDPNSRWTCTVSFRIRDDFYTFGDPCFKTYVQAGIRNPDRNATQFFDNAVAVQTCGTDSFTKSFDMGRLGEGDYEIVIRKQKVEQIDFTP